MSTDAQQHQINHQNPFVQVEFGIDVVSYNASAPEGSHATIQESLLSTNGAIYSALEVFGLNPTQLQQQQQQQQPPQSITESTLANPGDKINSFFNAQGALSSSEPVKVISFLSPSLNGAENNIKSGNSSSPASEECVVCLTDPQEVVLLPCRHLCVCHSCLVHIDKCPVCRTPFEEYMKIERQKMS